MRASQLSFDSGQTPGDTRRIEVFGDEAALTYTVPMPSDEVTAESASTLDFGHSGPSSTRRPK